MVVFLLSFFTVYCFTSSFCDIFFLCVHSPPPHFVSFSLHFLCLFFLCLCVFVSTICKIKNKETTYLFLRPKLPWDCHFENNYPRQYRNRYSNFQLLYTCTNEHIWKQKSYCIHIMDNAAPRNCGQRAKLFRILFRSIYHLDAAIEQRSLPYGGFEKHVLVASWWKWRELLWKEIKIN